MSNITDELLGGIDGIVSSGLGLFDKVKESVSKAVNTAKTGAKQYAASTPQGQAIVAAQKMASKQKSSGTVTTSVIPMPGQKKGIKGIFSSITKKKIFGIPVVIPVLSIFVGLPMLKKYAKK